MLTAIKKKDFIVSSLTITSIILNNNAIITIIITIKIDYFIMLSITNNLICLTQN